MIVFKTLFVGCSLAGMLAFVQVTGDVEATNRKWLEDVRAACLVSKVKSRKLETWVQNLKANQVALSTKEQSELDGRLDKIDSVSDLKALIDSAEVLVSEEKAFKAKQSEIISAKSRWHERLDRCVAKYTRELLLKRSNSDPQQDGIVLPRSVWVHHNRKAVRGLDFKPTLQGETLEFASAGTDKTVAVHALKFPKGEPSDEKVVSDILSVKGGLGIRYLKYGVKGDWFVTRDDDSRVYRWAVTREGDGQLRFPHSEINIRPSLTRKLTAVCIGQKGELYYAYDIKTAVKTNVFNVKSDTSEMDTPLFATPPPDSPVFKMCLSRSGTKLALACSDKIYILTLPLETNTEYTPQNIIAGSERAGVQGVNSMTALNESRFAYSLFNDKRVYWCDGNSRKVGVLQNPIGEILSLIYDSGRKLLIGGEYSISDVAGGRLVVWDMEKPDIPAKVIKGVGTLERVGHGGTVWSLALSPDHKWLLSGGNRGEICLWDLNEIERYVRKP
ncbi:MAG: hypothetical protein NT023_16960 [Armatimonadetes bacterium]|nr:hypothetical protein [Armatimonadota bacterium]